MSTKEEDNVLGWINGTGYPVEFRAAHILEKAGFSCLRGSYVVDKENDAALEIDVLASVFVKALDGTDISVQVCVECKHIKETEPWAFFRGGHKIEPYIRLQTMNADELGALALFQLATDLEFRQNPLLDTFFGGSPPSAYGGKTKAKDDQKGKEDAIYAALSGVIVRTNLLSAQSAAKRATITIPLVVTNSSLFIVSYSGLDDKIEVKSVDSVRADWNGTTRKAAASVKVVNLDWLEASASILFKSATELAEHLAKAVDTLRLVNDGPNLRAYLDTRQQNTPFKWPSLADAWLMRAEGRSI